jgi:hypothetical protein
MTVTRKRSFGASLILLGFAFALVHSAASARIEMNDERDSRAVSGYKSWVKVNPKPLKLPAALSVLCAAPTPASRADAGNNPHRQKYFTVYVNEVGRRAMIEQAKPQFPQGSIIVKEKLPDEQAVAPELLTVMIKREAGFNPQSGDWEYLVFDGTATKIEAGGKLENCQSCHAGNKASDYVFRSYLPDEMRTRLH